MSPERRRVLVVAALIEEADRTPVAGVRRILMSLRRPDQALPNCWEFPGGKVEPGESPEIALVREIREELDCTVTIGRIYDVVFYAYEAFDLVMLVYRAQIVDGVPRARQVAAVDWIDPRAIADLALPPADVPLALRLASEAKGQPSLL